MKQKVTRPENSRIPESEVVALWQESVGRSSRMTDSDGQPVEVIYPGRLNDSRGGDFRDAVVTRGDECKQGCIEVHSRTGDWTAHGHHRDPNYNQVVLHVALQQDRVAKTVLQNGSSVPTVLLNSIVPAKSGSSRAGGGLPCSGVLTCAGVKTRMEFLDRAGDLRLENKVSRFQSESGNLEGGQSLYQGLLEALGYSKNKLPFLELARRVPLRFLEDLMRREPRRGDQLLRLESVLMGQAGFLPSERPGFGQKPGCAYVDRLERIWSEFSASNALNFRDWELFKVRPGNHPVRRLAAAARLLQRFRSPGWLPSLVDLVRTGPPEKSAPVLEKALTVVDEGYWTSHYDFGLSNTSINAVLLGRQRAGEIIVNILVPFVLYWSRLVGEDQLSAKTLEIYRQYPRMEINSIEIHMLRQLNLTSHLVDSARRQQGLLHIYKTLCTQGKCAECGLNG
jgi:hypothetical protein